MLAQSKALLYTVLFFRLYFFYDWGKIALQGCVGFCCIMQISHNYTYITSLLSLPPFPLPHPYRSLQNTRLGSLCYIATSHQLSILHMVVCVCVGVSMLLSPLIYSVLPPLCSQVHSQYLTLCSFPANRFITTIFLDSIYMHILIYDICFALYDLLHYV